MNWESSGVSIALTLKALALTAPALLAVLTALGAALVLLRRATDRHAGLNARPVLAPAPLPGARALDTVAALRPLAGPVAPRAPRAPPAPDIATLLLPQLTPSAVSQPTPVARTQRARGPLQGTQGF